MFKIKYAIVLLILLAALALVMSFAGNLMTANSAFP